MRIVLDLQGAQTESRFRGIGRYTLAFAQAVVRNRGEHEVIVALNGYFPETIAPICTAFEGLLPTDNILVWHAPGPVRASVPANLANRQAAQLLREAFLANLQADVIHISSLFEGFLDDAVASIGLLDQRTPVSVSFYDLIPLLNPQQYLTSNPLYEKHYRSQVAALGDADLFLSISEFARSELLATLPVQAHRVVNVSTAAEPVFCQRTIEPDAAMALVTQWGIQKPFLLYTGGADERKNLERLLEAFAALPTALVEGHQLVLAGKMNLQHLLRLQQKMASLGLRSEQCIFTNYVSDAELVDLYHAAKAFIFPSWHEGFGIPPLEAMACGVPVIASNCTSIPEVVGLPEALFDPLDITNMRERIEQVLSDAPFRARLIAYGLMQTKSFSWDITAQRAITSFEVLHAQQAAAGKALPAQRWDQLQQHCEAMRARLVRLVAALAGLLTEQGERSDSLIARIARDIARNERTTLDYLRLGRLPTDMAWRIEGPFDSSYSLALVNREFARNLEAHGQVVLLHSSEGPGDFAPSPDFLRANSDLIPMHERSHPSYEPRSTGGVIVSRFMYPPRVADMRGRLNLIHGYAWEESGFPPEWVDEFNERLQGISVATEYVKKMLIDNGVHVPIAVTRLGVDHLERIAPQANYAVKAKAFRFLHVSSCFARKGVEVMLTAFGKAFTRSDEVTLIIKTFPNPHNDARALLAAHQAAMPDYPDVVIIEEDLSESELKALYVQCHALLAPSHAEGFGFPMAEAMLAGLAVITTNWSGHVDFCRPDTAWLVDYEFALACTHLNIADSVWAVPDVQDLTRVLREVHALPAAVRSERAARGRQLLLGEWTWSAATSRLIAAARQWALPANRAPLSIAWISSWNTRCGIAKYSEHLLAYFPGPVQVFAPHADDLVALDTDDVQRTWQLGGADDLRQLQEAIHLQGCNCIVIQFNYGFFNFAALTELIAQQVALGKQVFMILHATIDPEGHPDKRLHFLLPALAQCARILVHAVSDLNRLKALGLVHNVALFPHGILDAQQYGLDPLAAPAGLAKSKAGGRQSEVMIASYGFFLPHKGLLELIKAFALLRQHYPQARLRLVNAEYPIAISADLIAEAKRAIKAHALGGAVELHTDFLSDAQSLRLLQQADVIVFPYQATSESSSAAVRHGLATGRPVAVTPLAIFDDVASAVHTLPGMGPQAIAAGVGALLEELRSHSPAAQAAKARAQEWRASHFYSRIAKRLSGLIFGSVANKAGDM